MDEISELDLIFNELQADIQVIQITLQQMLLASLIPNPEGKEVLRHLQKQVLGILEKQIDASSDPQDAERLRLLTVARADRMFLPLFRFFEIPRPPIPDSQVN